MADITISTSRQSCQPDCNQLTIIEQPIMNKYSEIDESPSTDTDEPVQGMSVASNTMNLPLNITKMIQNKLKRKKKLSTSLTSVSEAANPEKRTRIEGIQLNCRGKLNEGLIAATTNSSPAASPTQMKLERAQSRTPVPSPRVAEKIILLQQSHQQSQQQQPQTAKVPPPRLKRKLEENVATIQKLNAQTEQMRLEIAELKSHLGTERGAVRVLRAQNESESRKWKNEVKKLQTAMELMRKVKKSKDEACANWAGNSSSSANGAKDANITIHELQRLTNEITTLREANRNLEEKLQISNDAERRKAADLRELKDSYEIRLTQLSKSAKTEISRLLEEIKTKERNIGQLKKETQTLQKHKTNQTTNHNNNTKKDTHTRNAAQHPSEMKKLKDIERNKNSNNTNTINCNVTNKNNTNTEKCFINTTCGDKEFHSMPHEFTERILEAHNDVHAYRSKDHQNSDSDSALSSAPPSISPQPPPTGMEPADIWQTIRNYTKDIEKVQNDLESIQKENESLQKELNLAKQQILESEKTAMEATNNAKKHQQLLDRIKCLEQRENELQEETHELREQNELLEFRILELEESNDKWSLQSNTTPNTKNVWNDGGKDADDAIIFTDRSDSGVTSPHSHHHIDDRINVISPCDLNLLDHMTNDDLRRRLSHTIKKPNIDEDDKICLQQVLAFIQNLDVMSHDSLPSSEESSSLEYIKSRVSDYSSSPRSSDISPTLQHHQKPKSAQPTGRIIATVLPYNSTISTPNDSPQRKQRAWNTSSLTESGVFEGDLSESSVYTQTEPEDFAYLETEAQKLKKFREQFEECATKSANAKVPVTASPSLSDEKRIQFYKDRLDVLESKLLIYESSGDLQAKRLADRLQREVQLENFVRELRDRVDFLEVENSQIEEEKCEYEEAENDTRLRLQRLEVELEILSQRNIELEMSREALQNKLKDCRSESAILRDDLAACQTQVCHLEEDRCRFKENIEFLFSILPALVLYNTFVVSGMGNIMDNDPGLISYDHHGKGMTVSCNCSNTEEGFRRESINLRDEIRSLKRQISDLNSRHTEAMSCADGYWEDLERSYNEQLMASKSKEDSLKQKIKQLEDCLQDDARAANEKICQLEDAERELRTCLKKVSRDHREIFQDHELIAEEYQRVKEKYDRLKEHVDGPIRDAMEREKTQNKNLKDELGYMRRTSCEQEMHYRNELDCFQVQLDKLHKELLQIQVTNSELREEVCTLEKEVVSLQQAKKEDIDKIRCLSDEVRTKEDMCVVLEKRVEALMSAPYYMQRQMRANGRMMSTSCSGAVPSLAQELNGSPVKRIKMEPKDLKTATKNLGAVLNSMKDNAKSIPSHKQFQNVANDVKKLADSLLATKSTVEVSQDNASKLEEETETPIMTEKYLRNLSTLINEDSAEVLLAGYAPEKVSMQETILDEVETMSSLEDNRPGTSQNDRHRDYSNLSNQPNTETCTGRRQQPAGPKQNQEAKDDDYNDNDDEDNENEQTSKDQYSTPRGSCLSSSEEFNDESNDLTPNGGRVQQMVPEIHLCWCNDPGNCLGFCSQSVVRNEQPITGAGSSSFLDFPEKSALAPIIDPLTSSHSLNIYSSLGEKDIPKRRNSCCDYSSPEPTGSLITIHSTKRRRSIGTAITPRESIDDKNRTLLTNIYDLLQSIRDEQILKSSADHVLRKAAQNEESLGDLHFPPPPPPPSSQSSEPSSGEQMQISSFNISSPISRQSDSATLLSTDNFESLRQSPSFFFDEPPERDLELNRSVYGTQQRLVPLDIELLGVDDDFELEPQKDLEFQVNGTFLYDLGVESEPEKDIDTGLPIECQVTTIESVACEPQMDPFNKAYLDCQIHETSFYDVIVEFPSSEDVIHAESQNNDAIVEIYLPEDAVNQDSLESRTQLCCDDLNYSENFSERGPGEDRSSKKEIPQTPQIVQFPRNEDHNDGRTAVSDLYTYAQQERPKDSGECECEEPESFSDRESGEDRSSKVGIPQTSQIVQLSRNGDYNDTKSAVSDLYAHARQERPKDSGECVCEEPEKCVCREAILEDSSLKDQQIDVPELAIFEDERLNAPSLQSMIISNQHVASNYKHGFTEEIQFATEPLIAPLEKHISYHRDDENINTKPSAPGQSDTDIEPKSCCNSKMATTEPQNTDACDFIDSILSDLEAMKEARATARFRWQSQQTQSFPVTIETVQELEPHSLFIKWKVHDIANITGYEIFLDGCLTNRYFNRVHRAAVICDVNLRCPHRITLRAQSQIKSKYRTAASACKCPPANTNPEIRQLQPDGSIWYPSVFNYEPNFLFSTS